MNQKVKRAAIITGYKTGTAGIVFLFIIATLAKISLLPLSPFLFWFYNPVTLARNIDRSIHHLHNMLIFWYARKMRFFWPDQAPDNFTEQLDLKIKTWN